VTGNSEREGKAGSSDGEREGAVEKSGRQRKRAENNGKGWKAAKDDGEQTEDSGK
jgi:hypothetical protein